MPRPRRARSSTSRGRRCRTRVVEPRVGAHHRARAGCCRPGRSWGRPTAPTSPARAGTSARGARRPRRPGGCGWTGSRRSRRGCRRRMRARRGRCTRACGSCCRRRRGRCETSSPWPRLRAAEVLGQPLQVRGLGPKVQRVAGELGELHAGGPRSGAWSAACNILHPLGAPMSNRGASDASSLWGSAPHLWLADARFLVGLRSTPGSVTRASVGLRIDPWLADARFLVGLRPTPLAR